MMILDSGTARSGILSAHWREISPDHTRAYDTTELEVQVFQATEDGAQILAAKMLVTMPGQGEGEVTTTYYNLTTGAIGQELKEPMPAILVFADPTTWAHIALDAVKNH